MCEYSILRSRELRYLLVRCKGCEHNASLGNPACLKGIFDLLIKEDPDGLILEKGYRKILRPHAFKELKKVIKALSSFRAEELCPADLRKFLSWLEMVKADLRKLKEIEKLSFCKEDAPKLKKLISMLKQSKLYGLRNPHDLLSFQILPIFCSFMLEEVSGKVIESYQVNGDRVEILRGPVPIYKIDLMETKLSYEELKALDEALEELTKLKHAKRDLETCKMVLKRSGKTYLAPLLYKYTFGYGVIESLLRDERIEDVFINSNTNKIFIYHTDYEECETNLRIFDEELDRIATKLRLLSERPFDEGFPVIHLELPELKVRVCGIREPLTFSGIGYAFRKHRIKPWTLQLFTANRMISVEASGFLNFLMEAQASILITGARGSGKTSLLGALLAEIPRKYRIIVIEDTPELPVGKLRQLGYNIEHLRIRAYEEGYELGAEEALRTSLRLGESVLVIGEVRGKEALSLFEAMRVGAVGNVVLGTIHGSSAYDVWDRIVNDLGVPPTSFKATDLIITCMPLRKGLRRVRRVYSMVEVLKHWKEDPLAEGGFMELMKYDAKRDKLKFTSNLKKSLLLQKISELRGWTLKQTLNEIKFRIELKRLLMKYARKNPELMSYDFTSKFVTRLDELIMEGLNRKRIYNEIKRWLRQFA